MANESAKHSGVKENDVFLETRKDNYYREINFYRRHYSQIRFAIFPLYLAIQSGLIRFSFTPPDSVQSCIPLVYLFSVAGFLITYVFWTIESRVLSYYKYLNEVGSSMERDFGPNYKLILEWPRSNKITFKSILNNTELSIKLIFIVFIIYWLSTIFFYLYNR